MTEDGKCKKDIKRRTGIASAMVNKISKLWRAKNIVPIVLYGSECRYLRKKDEQRILVAEMTWLRRLLRVTRHDRMKNETVQSTLHQERRLVNRIAQRRLTMVRACVKDKQWTAASKSDALFHNWNQGRPPKKWINKIKQDRDTRNIQFDEAMAMVQDRVKWKRLIAASTSLWWKRKKRERKVHRAWVDLGTIQSPVWPVTVTSPIHTLVLTTRLTRKTTRLNSWHVAPRQNMACSNAHMIIPRVKVHLWVANPWVNQSRKQ